jgi:signal transduction histidine kinase
MIHRGAAFAIVIVVVTAAFVVAVDSLELEGTLGSLRLPFEGIVLALVAAVCLSFPVAPRLARLIDKYFLRSRPDLDRALQEAARRLSRVFTEADITAEIETTLRTNLGVGRAVVLRGSLERRDLPVAVANAAWTLPRSSPALVVLAQESDPSDVAAQIRTLRDSGFEVWVSMRRGSQRTGIILLGPRNDGEAYLATTLQFIEDIAELSSMAYEVASLHQRQIELERESHRLEHLARMGRAYAGLGHEIRTPLTTISNLVALIPERLEDAEFRDVLTRLIPGEIARIVRLTERLRLLAPADHAQLQPISVATILRDLASIVGASAPHVRVHLEIPTPVPAICGDESQLVQLFTNLVNNAVDAMPHGGAITLRVAGARTPQGEPALAVHVIDEGVGISSDVAARLFEPFFTTKPLGTGLGLSICREIANFHGATLQIRTRDQARGSIATVEFPLEIGNARNSASLTAHVPRTPVDNRANQ